MLYIGETLTHFGLLVLLCAITLLMLLIGILAVLKRESPSASGFSGFLSILFAFFAFLILAIMVYQLPATATTVQLVPYYLGAWSCVALHGFFVVFYGMSFEWFHRRKWTVYLPILGTISFLSVLWIFTTPATTIVVFDGAMNWLAMPVIVYAYGGILAIFYMFLVPLIATYQLNKTSEGAVKMWNWITWLGSFLWFIAAIMMALVLYLAPYMLIGLGLAAIAWILLLIGWFFANRALTQQK
jgi:hypothetical protein